MIAAILGAEPVQTCGVSPICSVFITFMKS